MAAVAGKLDFIAGGVRWTVAGSFTIRPFQTSKEPVVGVNGPAGYKEMGVAPSIEAELITTADTRLKLFEAMSGVTASVKLANGLQYILTEAFVEGEPDINPIDGTVTVLLKGTSCDEI